MAQLRFGAGDSVSFGTTEATTASTAVLDGSQITNLAVGDLVVAIAHDQTASVTATSGPSGLLNTWTRVGAPNDASNGRQTGVWYYKITSTIVRDQFLLATTQTWTFASSGRVSCIAARATGIDLDNVLDVAAAAFTTGSGVGSVAIGSVTAVATSTLLVAALHRQNSAGTNPTLTSIGSMTVLERRTSTSTAISQTSVALGYETVAGAGAVGTRTALFSANVTTFAGELVAFKIGSWPAAPTGKFTSATDTLSTAGKVYYTSATDTLTAPIEVRPIPTGYTTAAAMIAGASTGSPCYIAHRGGSLDWPEMSLHAYTQAVFWGVGALEVSLARTSDGVWFGLHDTTLDRTSGTSSLDPSTLTWAQILASYTISTNLPTGQTAKPYMLLTDLLTAYKSSHVFFIDIKSDVTFLTELADLIDASGITPGRVVLKQYGVSATTVPVLATARGYKSWGYFYQADSASYAGFTGRWDYLGLDYQADAATWTSFTTTAAGKPILGHICPDAAAVTTCTSRGAIGAMVSGVVEAITRST